MQLKQLYVKNLRNFDELDVSFVPKINEIVGENAQGKTSLLEAIALCLTGTSFRSHSLKDVIKHGQKGFFVEATFEKSGITYLVALAYDGQTRKVFLNKKSCQSASVLFGLLAGVTSTPEDIDLIKGAPGNRRRFLDLQIAQVDPLYVHHLSRYIKALKQRNSLLKQKVHDAISCWEEILATSGAYIVSKRQESTAFLKKELPPLFTHFTFERVDLELSYKSTLTEGMKREELVSFFTHEYAKKRSYEMMYGQTLVGPHRDDLQFYYKQKPFREFASEGQQYLAACCLKFAGWRYLKKEIRDIPLMVIDDFGAALDASRKKLLFDEMQTLGQVFLSSHQYIGKNYIWIEAGKITKVV
jgi:DNA replication and repair protein RecF